MLSWQKIREQFENEWVAMKQWEEDEHGEVLKGNVIYHNPSQKNFYEHLKNHLRKQSLAVRFTGNIKGPFFLDS